MAHTHDQHRSNEARVCKNGQRTEKGTCGKDGLIWGSRMEVRWVDLKERSGDKMGHLRERNGEKMG
eukprot:1157788-Pelagomonas_calceolata.AAC.6